MSNNCLWLNVCDCENIDSYQKIQQLTLYYWFYDLIYTTCWRWSHLFRLSNNLPMNCNNGYIIKKKTFVDTQLSKSTTINFELHIYVVFDVCPSLVVLLPNINLKISLFVVSEDCKYKAKTRHPHFY